MQEIIDKAGEFAGKFHAKDPENPEGLERHVQLVRKYALKLADIEGAEPRIIEIAAILHDIGKFKGTENHHLDGYRIAKGFLQDIDLSDTQKDIILKCILNHRTRFAKEKNMLEIRIIQSADVLGALFDDEWQAHSRKVIPKNELLELYDLVMKKITLESALKIAEPRMKFLIGLLERTHIPPNTTET